MHRVSRDVVEERIDAVIKRIFISTTHGVVSLNE